MEDVETLKATRAVVDSEVRGVNMDMKVWNPFFMLLFIYLFICLIFEGKDFINFRSFEWDFKSISRPFPTSLTNLRYPQDATLPGSFSL